MYFTRNTCPKAPAPNVATFFKSINWTSYTTHATHYTMHCLDTANSITSFWRPAPGIGIAWHQTLELGCAKYMTSTWLLKISMTGNHKRMSRDPSGLSCIGGSDIVCFAQGTDLFGISCLGGAIQNGMQRKQVKTRATALIMKRSLGNENVECIPAQTSGAS